VGSLCRLTNSQSFPHYPARSTNDDQRTVLHAGDYTSMSNVTWNHAVSVVTSLGLDLVDGDSRDLPSIPTGYQLCFPPP
jgi:hypothetical protein